MRLMTIGWAMVLCAGAIAGCGGGGNSSTGDSATSYPLAVAVQNMDATSYAYSVTGTSSSGTRTTLGLANVPGPTATYQGLSVQTSIQTLSMQSGSSSPSTSVYTDYYSTGPYRMLASVGTSGAQYVSTSFPSWPSSAVVGFSMTGPSQIHYASDGTVHSRISTTIDLRADTESTAWMCVTYASVRETTKLTSTSANCFRIDRAGAIRGWKYGEFPSGQAYWYE